MEFIRIDEVVGSQPIRIRVVMEMTVEEYNAMVRERNTRAERERERAEIERQNEIDRERERQWYADMGDRLSE